jgi:PAS domain S-box-containing protein
MQLGERHFLSGVQSGEHICHLYETQEERWNFAAPFLLDGCLRGEKIVLFTEDAGGLEAACAARGLDLKPGLADGSVVVVRPGGIFTAFLAGSSIAQALLQRAIGGVLEKGFQGVRVLGDAAWLERIPIIQDRWIAFERRLTHMLEDMPGVVLCQYRRGAFTAKKTLALFRLHPYVVVGDEIFSNPYFEPGDERSPERGAREVLDRSMRWLSERKRVEDGLYHSEQYFRALYDEAPLAYQSLDANGRLIAVNQEWCDLAGYQKDEVIGRWYGSFLVPAQQEHFHSRFDMFKQRGYVQGAEFEMVCKNGETIFVSADGKVAHNLDGSFRQTHCILSNITERKRAEAKIEQQMRRLAALRTIDSAIQAKVSLQSVMRLILKQVTEQLEVRAAAILLYNPGENLLSYGFGRGFRTMLIEQSRVPLGQGLAGLIAQHRATMKSDNLPNDTRFFRRELFQQEDFQVYFGTPLVAKGQLLGVLETFHSTPPQDEGEWREYLETLAGQAAIAMEDARMYEGMLRSNEILLQAYDETIRGWTYTLDLRDHETEGHSQRVTELTNRLAEKMGIAEEARRTIRWGALLHDIGKVGVPDHILLKAGDLTPEEWQVMVRHPQLAYDALSPIAFLRSALDIPYCHHEKWDGTGYPRGLRGEEIPLSARIFAVVDVWDALLSDRPYRKGWSPAEAKAYIADQAGRHFDPQVVCAFLALLEEEMPAQVPLGAVA